MPDSKNFQVVILHLDMDAFFTSVEQHDNPHLQGQPVMVGYPHRGVVAAASYEARQYGVHSAMPVVKAQRLCPSGIFLPGRMQRYKEVSAQIMTIMRKLCPVVEQASVDEAYADISGMGYITTPATLAKELKAQIFQKTGLTSSIGIAPCRFLAKIASDWQKPDGVTIITAQNIHTFLDQIPLYKIPGVGEHMRKILDGLGVHDLQAIRQHPRIFWEKHLGTRGAALYDRAHGTDHTPVTEYRASQSCSAEITFPEDITEPETLEIWLLRHAEQIGNDLRRKQKKGRCITLKLRFHDFTTITRSQTLEQPTHSTRTLYQTACTLLRKEPLEQPIRLVGLGISLFGSKEVQARLPIQIQNKPEIPKNDEQLDRVMDRIKERFGSPVISRANVSKIRPQTDLLSQKKYQATRKEQDTFHGKT